MASMLSATSSTVRQRALTAIGMLCGAISGESLALAADTPSVDRTVDHDRIVALGKVRADALIEGMHLIGVLFSPGASPDDCPAATSERVSKVYHDALDLADKIHKDEAKAIHQAWKGLLRGNGKVATKRASQASQLPSQWRSEAVPTDEGAMAGMSADPLAVLQAERDKLNKLWRGLDSPNISAPCPPWGWHEPLPALLPELRRSMTVFMSATSASFLMIA